MFVNEEVIWNIKKKLPENVCKNVDDVESTKMTTEFDATHLHNVKMLTSYTG